MPQAALHVILEGVGQHDQHGCLAVQSAWACQLFCSGGRAAGSGCDQSGRVSKSITYRCGQQNLTGSATIQLQALRSSFGPSLSLGSGQNAGTGLVYLLFWPLYPPNASSRYLCASVPGLASMYFFAVGVGAYQDAGLLKRSTVGITMDFSMQRNGISVPLSPVLE